MPGLVDLAAIAELTAGPLPVAVMVWPGAPSVAELAAAGGIAYNTMNDAVTAAPGLPS